MGRPALHKPGNINYLENYLGGLAELAMGCKPPVGLRSEETLSQGVGCRSPGVELPGYEAEATCATPPEPN
jgi:hypothetical protein